MSDNLVEETVHDTDDIDSSDKAQPKTDTPRRPEAVPEKFWDAERGEIRTDAMIKSYAELERKLGSLPHRNVPSSPDEYQIHVDEEILETDPEVNARLCEAGFTQEQAQLVYELAVEKLAPIVAEVASMFETESQIERLAGHFGGKQRWREISGQLSSWGRNNLPAPVFEALASSFDGVIAMHQMMSHGEPALVREGATSNGGLSEVELKQMMRDPKYWKEHDPVYVQKIRDGFRQLYPE